jgi:hypothetical protein
VLPAAFEGWDEGRCDKQKEGGRGEDLSFGCRHLSGNGPEKWVTRNGKRSLKIKEPEM